MTRCPFSLSHITSIQVLTKAWWSVLIAQRPVRPTTRQKKNYIKHIKHIQSAIGKKLVQGDKKKPGGQLLLVKGRYHRPPGRKKLHKTQKHTICKQSEHIESANSQYKEIRKSLVVSSYCSQAGTADHQAKQI